MLELIPEQYHELYNVIITLLPTITALCAQIITFILTLKRVFSTARKCTDDCTQKCNELMSGNDMKELKKLVETVIAENNQLKNDYARMTEICTRVKIKREENYDENHKEISN